MILPSQYSGPPEAEGFWGKGEAMERQETCQRQGDVQRNPLRRGGPARTAGRLEPYGAETHRPPDDIPRILG